MAEYINREEMLKYIEEHNTLDDWMINRYNADWIYSFIDSRPTADVVEVVRCKDCKHWNNGDCYRIELTRPTDFCSYGTPKERDADKPKITCLNCKHLMFSDMYGECNIQLRIVRPSDTCEYAEPKERGGEK